MTRRKEWSIFFGAVVLCVAVYSVVVKTYFAEKSSAAHTAVTAYDYLCDVTRALDSLNIWQSGDTPAFLQSIAAQDYPSHLRDMIKVLIRDGREAEVTKFLNMDIDHWIIFEAGNTRPYKWPDRELDKDGWDLLARIYENRRQHPHSTGDDGCDATIKEILERTQ